MTRTPDALGLLRREHRRLEELLAEAEAGSLATLAGAFRDHVDATEGIFYPAIREAAREHGERGGDGPTLRLLVSGVRQHGELIKLLDGLLVTAATGIEELDRQLRRHLDDEETGVMTVAEDLLNDATLFDLGRRMAERGQVLGAQEELAQTVAPAARAWLRWGLAGTVLLGGLAMARHLARRGRGRGRCPGPDVS